MEALLTEAEVAEVLRCSLGTVRKLRKAGELRHVRLCAANSHVRYRPEDVRELLERSVYEGGERWTGSVSGEAVSGSESPMMEPIAGSSDGGTVTTLSGRRPSPPGILGDRPLRRRPSGSARLPGESPRE